MSDQPLELLLTRISLEARDVISLDLRAVDGGELPAWQPGAHLELQLPSGRLRHYSLCGDPADRHCYRLGILHQTDGRGGSREIHEQLRVGLRLQAKAPGNLFALEPAPAYLFIAGGIGITPILTMLEQLGQDTPWRLLYGGRSLDSMAFRERIGAGQHITLWPEDQHGQLPLGSALDACEPGTAVYCCGPNGLLDALQQQCSTRPQLRLVMERFSAAPPPPTGDEAGFTVILARSGQTLQVGPEQSVLSVVREACPNVPWSCESGFCGACETPVLEGDIEHRDQLLSADEQAANRSMMICVSRARSARLVLDI